MYPLKSSDNELTTLNCIHFHIFMVILAFGKCLITESSEGCEIEICLQKVDVTVLSVQLMMFKADMFFICTESLERIFVVKSSSINQLLYHRILIKS